MNAKKGTLEDFFVSSVEFCKHIKFDDKRDRDVKIGPQGPQGPKGDTGATGATGPQGIQGTQDPQGITQLVNGTNIYSVEAEANGTNRTIQAFARCDTGDFPLSGGYSVFIAGFVGTNVEHLINEPEIFNISNLGWFTRIEAEGPDKIFLTVKAFCFDNPPPHGETLNLHRFFFLNNRHLL